MWMPGGYMLDAWCIAAMKKMPTITELALVGGAGTALVIPLRSGGRAFASESNLRPR